MKKGIILFLSLILIVLTSYAQQTVGLFVNEANAFDGYTLFAPINNTETYLIDNCGEKVHSWSSNFRPGLSCYLLEDGTLLRTGRLQMMGNGSGMVEMIDWDGNVIWSYSAISTHGKQHHDIELLPNGNILLIVNDIHSAEELEDVGSSTNNESIISEQIIEIEPNIETGGATVVWEWRAWDHLIQDVDASKPNYGIIADHPERMDINFLNHNNDDWLHFNGVDYNEDFDQIIVSIRNLSEFWIIDHSTTTNEAAGSTGGIYGKGGDILYRWGNPQTYDQGNPSDQKLFLQHHTHWLSEPLEDAGKILLFNNQAGNLEGIDYSTVNTVKTPVDEDGFYEYSGGAFGPNDFDWTYQAENPTDFYSSFISGVQRLENGNTLICEGRGGRFFEIDQNENIVWEYINPVNNQGIIPQNTIPEENNVFRCTRYATDYKGFEGRTLEPQGYIETGSTFECNTVVSTTDHNHLMSLDILVYPNQTSDFIHIQMSAEHSKKDLKRMSLYDLKGRRMYQSSIFKEFISVQDMPKGMYFIQFDFGHHRITKKIIVQ